MNGQLPQLQLLTSTEDWVFSHFYICRFIKHLHARCFWNRRRKIWDYTCSIDCRYDYCLTAMDDLEKMKNDAYVADYKLDRVILGQDAFRREICSLELLA